MPSLKLLASLLSLVDSLFAILFALGALSIVALPMAAQMPGAPGWALAALGIVFLIDSLVCLAGFRTAFYLGAVLSATTAAELVLFAAPLSNSTWLVGVILSLVTVVFDILAARSTFTFTEQGNPMNLPIFG